jgi:hypothetical protein
MTGDARKPAACVDVVPGRLREWSHGRLSRSRVDFGSHNGSISNIHNYVALNDESHALHRLDDQHYPSSDHDDPVHYNVPGLDHNDHPGRFHDHLAHHHDNGRNDHDGRPAHCHGHHHRHQLRLLAGGSDHQSG